MTEAYTSPDGDPFHLQEAKQFFDRMKVLHLSNPVSELPPYKRENSSFFKSDRSIVIVRYYPTRRISEDDKKVFSVIDESFQFEYPSVTFRLTGNFLYHSLIGNVSRYVPRRFLGSSGELYEAHNRFVINSVGQSYREDSLIVILDHELMGRTPKQEYPQLEISADITDITTRMNPLDEGDYELIGYYLDQIDQGRLERP
jgi:hypothetical protein